MAASAPRIFISHSTTDHDFCLRLVNDLQRLLDDESAVWYDAHGGLHGGDSWWRKIVQELTSRNIFIVVLSPAAMASDWVNDEIDMAWRLKNSPVKMRLFPLLYRQCQVRPDLENLQIIRFLAPKPYETAFEELLHALGLAQENSNRKGETPSAPVASPQKTRKQWIDKGRRLLNPNLKHYEELLTAQDRDIRLNPNYAFAYFKKGLILYNLKRYEEALTAYDQAIRLNPNDDEAYYNKGLVLYNLKRYEEALTAYEQVIRLDPNDDEAYNNEGKTLRKMGKTKEAEQAFEKARQLRNEDTYDQAIRLNPNDAHAYYKKGDALRYRQRYREALTAYDQAIRLNPEHANAHFYKGFVLHVLKRYEEALTAYDQCIRLDPNNPSVYDEKGEVLRKMGKAKEAEQAFEKARQLRYTG